MSQNQFILGISISSQIFVLALLWIILLFRNDGKR
jgi:hypothetical protein